MCGLIGRRCLCESCGKISREERKQRLITSVVFLGTLWLVNLIGNPLYWLAAIATWTVLLIAVEWRYIYEIPLVPMIDSERWKRIKDVFAWSFIGLILATFVSAAVFNML